MIVDGGGQLARAAAYIRECATQRSPAFDEFVCWTLKDPPDRMTESESKRQPTLLAVSKIETSAYMHSPITSAALTLLAPLPAILSQADSFSESSMRLDQLVLKPPDNGGPRRCLHDTVSSKLSLSVERHSPRPVVVIIPPIPKPVPFFYWKRLFSSMCRLDPWSQSSEGECNGSPVPRFDLVILQILIATYIVLVTDVTCNL